MRNSKTEGQIRSLKLPPSCCLIVLGGLMIRRWRCACACAGVEVRGLGILGTLCLSLFFRVSVVSLDQIVTSRKARRSRIQRDKAKRMTERRALVCRERCGMDVPRLPAKCAGRTHSCWLGKWRGRRNRTDNSPLEPISRQSGLFRQADQIQLIRA